MKEMEEKMVGLKGVETKEVVMKAIHLKMMEMKNNMIDINENVKVEAEEVEEELVVDEV
jgi:hypothetical protein